MRRIFKLRGHSESIRENQSGGPDRWRSVDSRTSDFDFGLEVALSWVGQLETQLDILNKPSALAESIKSVLGDVFLVILELQNTTTSVVYSDFKISDELLEKPLEPMGVFGALARIRFTRFFESGTKELLDLGTIADQQVEHMVAIPLFNGGIPCGCIAAATSQSGRVFQPTHAMVLSLAGTVYSLAKELEEARHTEI